MNALAPIAVEAATLPALVRRAANKLAAAEGSAEVLDARDEAGVIYDAAKRAGRIARAKSAHDEVVAAVYRAQGDALEIEAMAKRRLADEYDAAQERGEVRGANERTTSSPEAVGVANLGLTHKDIYEARQIRDAEVAEPGIVRRTVDHLIETGAEPTKAAVRAAIISRPTPKPRVSDSALWLWGRLRDFETGGYFTADPEQLFNDMTEPMRADVLRLAPLVSDFLNSLETSHEPA